MLNISYETDLTDSAWELVKPLLPLGMAGDLALPGTGVEGGAMGNPFAIRMAGSCRL